MKKFVAMLFLCHFAHGQSVDSGASASSGAAFYAGYASSCAAPNFCAYTGADLINWGTVPNFGGAVNNNAVGHDASYLGHTNFDGSTFSNSALLSPVTRVTDTLSYPGGSARNYAAGMGGSGAFTLTGTNLSNGGWVRIDDSGSGRVCLFNAPAYPGHCQPASAYANTGGLNPASGIFLTTNMCAGAGCASGGSASTPQNFGSFEFSRTDPGVLYSFGGNGDVSNPLAVFSYSLSLLAGSVGVYSVGPALVDWQYGLPLGAVNAPNWTPSTTYAHGAYVTHPLNPPGGPNPEYLAYSASTAYNAGDIVVPGAGGVCMYRAISGGSTNAAVLADSSFNIAAPCKNDIVKEASPSTLQWRGTNSTAQFLYQNTGTGGAVSAATPFRWLAAPAVLAADGAISSASGRAVLTSASNPFSAAMVGQTISVAGAGAGGTTPLYTTVFSFQNSGQVTLAIPASHITSAAAVTLTGHPDLFSQAVGDGNGIVWTNIGPSYLPTLGSQLWQALGGVNADTANGGKASRYAIAISTDSYGVAPNYQKYNADQGTGVFMVAYDALANTYHLVNTLTGIWTDWGCSGGAGYNCAGGARTATTIGDLTNFTNPFGSAPPQPCPLLIHNVKMSRNGRHIVLANQANLYAACNAIQNFGVWQPAAAFNPAASFQFTYFGLNHWGIATDKLVAFSPTGWGYGSYLGVYDANNPQGNNGLGGPLAGYPAPVSVYLYPLASQATQQTSPPGCYITTGAEVIRSPDCTLGEALDSHLSMAGDPGTDNYPACGTTFNYATNSPIAFNSWQNMETCYSTYPTYPAGYSPPGSVGQSLPANASLGSVWQFTHTFATGTSKTFATQFQISEYSQDANWLFWSSDWDCQSGSTLGSAPAVYSGGTYYQTFSIAPVPASPSSLCGLPWQAAASYAAGNTINPIEGTSGSGAVDDVFQALASGTSGPASSLTSGQPNCGGSSCFVATNPPAVAPLSVTAATEAGATGTITVVSPGLTLNTGVLVTLSGMSPNGWNGTWPVSSAAGTGVTTLTLSGMPAGLGAVTTMGTAAAQGDTVCDAASGASLNPALPYSASCAGGVVWQDLGPQTQRGDVFAVNLGNQH